MASTLALLRRLQTAKVEFVLCEGTLFVNDEPSQIRICVEFTEATQQSLSLAFDGSQPEFTQPRGVRYSCAAGVFHFVEEMPGVGTLARVMRDSVAFRHADFTAPMISSQDLVTVWRTRGTPEDLRRAEHLEARLLPNRHSSADHQFNS